MVKQMCTITQVNKKLDINKIDNRCPTVKQYNGKTINNKVISIKGRKDDQLFPIDEMILTDAKHVFNLTVTITSKRDDDDLIINFIPGSGDNMDAEFELWQKLGFWEFLDGSVIEVVKQRWIFNNYQWEEETYVHRGIPADMYWGDFKISGGEITKSIIISESDVKDNFIKSFKINDFEIIGNKLEKDKYIVNFIFNNPKDTSRPKLPGAFNPIVMKIGLTNSDGSPNLVSVYINERNAKVVNPTLYKCTAYIEYNGSVGERSSKNIKHTFKSTYKLLYDPKTPDDSTLSVENLSFDIDNWSGIPYVPKNEHVIILKSVKINKFESNLSTFNGMKLYYPEWNDDEYKYNLVSTTWSSIKKLN